MGNDQCAPFRIRARAKPVNYRELRAEMKEWAKDKPDPFIQLRVETILANLRRLERDPDNSALRQLEARNVMALAGYLGEYRKWAVDPAEIDWSCM